MASKMATQSIGEFTENSAKAAAAAGKSLPGALSSATRARKLNLNVGGTAENCSKLGKVAGKAAKIAGPAGYVIEGTIRGVNVYKTEMDYREGKITESQRGLAHAKNAGGFIGGTGGAAAGAAAGAAIGAPFGGIGAVPGAVIGGIVGGVAGGFGGDMAGSEAGGWIYGKVTQ